MKVPRLILHLESFLATLCTGRKQHADPEACTPATGVPTCPISGDNLAPIPLKEAGSPIKNDHLIPPGTMSIISQAVRISQQYGGTRATEGGDGNLNLQLNNKRTRIGIVIVPRAV
jgi:hypothetical protein